jgi:hypothetical protein
VSGEETGDDYDLETIIDGGDGDGGVPHGDLLLEFAEAVLDDDDTVLAASRDKISDALGWEAFVDVAGVIASFNSVVRVADATGIPVESFKEESAEKLNAEFSIKT